MGVGTSAAEQSKGFEHFQNCVALPREEAFRIEYWALEEAKLQRMPAEAEFSRKIALVIGGGSGIGREVALLLARRGAHIVVADLDLDAAASTAADAAKLSSSDAALAFAADLSSSESLASAVKFTVQQFGGIDAVFKHRRHLPGSRRRWPFNRSSVGPDIPDQRHRQFPSGAANKMGL